MIHTDGRPRLFFFVILALPLLSWGCLGSGGRSDSDEIVFAAVNGTKLTESELRAIVPMNFYDKLSSEHKKEIVREWVHNELLYQQAVKLGIDKESDIARILQNSKRNFLSSELLERELAGISLPGDHELREYYDSHKDYFILQTREYEVRYALFDNHNDAQRFWRNVKAGRSFSHLAEEDSKDPSARSGGELGIVNEESVETAVWEAIIATVENLGIGKISNPFRVIDGFGIVIIDRVFEKGSIKPFEAVKEQVRDFYMADKREETKDTLLRRLSGGAKITYNF